MKMKIQSNAAIWMIFAIHFMRFFFDFVLIFRSFAVDSSLNFFFVRSEP